MAQGRISRNTFDGKFIADVERLGFVPPCVRDAFSWLPFPVSKNGKGKKARLVWYWEAHDEPPPEIMSPDSPRCNECIFQEPAWSEGYAGCSHSWLHDRDGDCRAFMARQEVLELRPDYAKFCVPIRPVAEDDLDWERLSSVAYWRDGTRFCDFRPSLNFPSHFFASLNATWLDEVGLYAELEQERLRRFLQWAKDETLKRTGMYQGNLFLLERE